MNGVIASINEMLSDGWVKVNDFQPPKSYPEQGFVLVRRGDELMMFSYSIYEDSSDYPGEDAMVRWFPAVIDRVVINKARFKRDGE